MSKPPRQTGMDGYVPPPRKIVTNGYVGPTSQATKPPTGGSSVKPPPTKGK